MTLVHLEATIETWPLSRAFVIARGAKTDAVVVVVHASDGQRTGRGECVPYARYGETPEGVAHTITTMRALSSRAELQMLPPGAARNAIDCALWDLEAKQSGRRAHELAGLPSIRPLTTFYTLSLGPPHEMAAMARSVPHLKMLKLKLGGAGDDARLRAVRAARPDARLIADANEAWSTDVLAPFLAAAAEARLELIEQPVPADQDRALAKRPHPVPICADESVHTTGDLARLKDRYEAVNIKLDKAGGLTEALAMSRAAREMGFKIMTGCMVATSLAMAPALLIAQQSDWIDLDGPLLLARDRDHGLQIENGIIAPPCSELWG